MIMAVTMIILMIIVILINNNDTIYLRRGPEKGKEEDGRRLPFYYMKIRTII